MTLTKKLQLYKNFFTFHRRSLPHFLIIGGQKCGTTTIFNYIIQHPQVISPLKKEMQYFDKKHYLNDAWYRAHFPLKEKLGEKFITGEKSTDYIFHPVGAKRIKRTIKNPKLILFLRNPAERAISQYKHMVRTGHESRPPKAAFEEEEETLDNIGSKALYKPSIFNRKKIDAYLRFSYIQKGLYLDQIKRFHKYFSEDQLFIEAIENLSVKPSNVTKRVYQFLEIDEDFIPSDLSKKNIGGYKLDENLQEMYIHLQRYYQSHNKALFDYLGKKFPWG
ncbi:MAG: sulfotransferase domain-containing protein [Bacteroidales bacterium]